jgi:carboxyl-terminal processing protease
MHRTFASLLALASLLPWLARPCSAGEQVCGDLPPGVSDAAAVLDLQIAGEDAQALFERLHRLLVERVGADRVSDTELYLGAMQGMVEVANLRMLEDVSPKAAVLPSPGMLLLDDEANRLAEGLDGKLTGLGIEFQLYGEVGVIAVSRVLPGSPAERVGLQPGDQIVSLDGRPFAGADLETVISMLQGGLGSQVSLDVLRGEGLAAARYRVTLERQAFAVRSVGENLRPNGVGYIQVFQFHKGTPTEVEESLRSLKAQGADRYLLDLRNNPGGDLSAAADVADLFLPRETVLMRTVEPGQGERDLVAKRDPVTADSLAVLVNGWTLGAAEAVAATLQEHGRAYVIGEPTMGVGRTQTLVALGHGLTLRLDSVWLQTPTGRSWQGKGILPDLPIWSSGTPSPDAYEAGLTDPQFETAVHYLETAADGGP